MRTNESNENRGADAAAHAVERLTEVSAAGLIKQLGAAVDERPAVLAFDADGTLWTGDVSDDVFLTACHECWLLDAAVPALKATAQNHGLSSAGSASALALRLFEAWHLGLIQERDLYAAMTVCYAGHQVEKLTQYAADVLLRKNLPHRLRRETQAVFDWAASRHVRCVVVSASPQPIVSWAAARVGFPPECVIGAQIALENGVMGAKLAAPVPFGTHKCKLLKRHASGCRILAAFGDSDFDFEMLACAEMAVGVSPKPELQAKLLRLRRAVVLKTEE